MSSGPRDPRYGDWRLVRIERPGATVDVPASAAATLTLTVDAEDTILGVGGVLGAALDLEVRVERDAIALLGGTSTLSVLADPTPMDRVNAAACDDLFELADGARAHKARRRGVGAGP